MKTSSFFVKTIAIFGVILLSAMTVNAQKIWINGYVFEKTGNEAVAVPFATVYYCNIDDHQKVEYVGFTDLSGKYDIGNNVAVNDYFVKIEAPGYETKEKRLGKLPKSFKGNLTLHFGLSPKSDKAIVAAKTYTPQDLSSEKVDALELLLKVPGVKQDRFGNLRTSSDGSIKLLLNGFEVKTNDLSSLKEVPYRTVSRIEYYDLSAGTSIYKGVVNISLAIGDQAKLTFVPFETTQFNLQ